MSRDRVLEALNKSFAEVGSPSSNSKDDVTVLAMPVFDSHLAPYHPLLPAAVQADFSAGLELIGLGEPRQAAEHLERVLEAAPEFADGHIALGMAYAVGSKVYAALDHLEKAAQLEPENFFAHFKLGQLYFKLRVPQKGYEGMARALECATSVRERKLVAQLVHGERQREHAGVRRPTWNRPFSRSGIYIAAAMGAAAVAMLLLHVH